MKETMNWIVAMVIMIMIMASVSCSTQYGITNPNPNKKHRDGVERVHKTSYHWDSNAGGARRRFPMSR